MIRYDAFVSYSHAKDKPIAAALHPLCRSSASRGTGAGRCACSVTTPACRRRRACGRRSSRRSRKSRYLILLASPEAAASPWVGKEVAHWLEHKGADTLLIALTGGTLAWDGASGDFARHETTPLPPALAGRFTSEPKWVDLTAYRDGSRSARRQVHLARGRLRGRHPRHAEGGLALAGAAAAAQRAAARLSSSALLASRYPRCQNNWGPRAERASNATTSGD